MGDKLYRDDEADARMARTRSAVAYLPRVLAYPLTGFCLPVIVMVALAMALGVQSLFGLPLMIIMSGWSAHYLVAIVEHSANGHATPPPMRGEVMHLASTRFVGALLLPALIATAAQADDTHPVLAIGFMLLGLLALPANYLILATEGDLAASLNPVRWLQVMLAIGPAYALAALAPFAGALLPMQFDASGSVAAATAMSCYICFASAHLIGYLAWQHRDALNLHAEVRDPDAVEAEQEQERRLATLLARIDESLRNGDQAAALREILAAPAGPADPLRFHEDLFTRVLTRAPPAVLHGHGRRYISLLLEARRANRALEVYETCARRHGHFEPEQPRQVEALAREALVQKLDELFLKLVRDLATRFPGDPVIVSAGLVEARYWSEQKSDDTRARAVLATLLAYAQHPQHAQVVALDRALASLSRHEREESGKR